MGAKFWTEAEITAVRRIVGAKGWNKQAIQETAEAVNKSYHAVRVKGGELGLGKVQPAGRPLASLLEFREDEYERKRQHHRSKKLVSVQTEDGPIAIALFGDPHVDDPGSDLYELRRALNVVKTTPGMYAVNIGDLTNNWIGRLARLHGSQTTTEDEAVELMRWLLSEIPWLMVVLGNHDVWSVGAKMVCQERSIPYVSHGAVLSVEPSGLKIDARHHHRGHSMYNPAHGQIKRAYRGSDCDVIVGGHTHQGADTALRNGVTGKLNHCVRVGSFKNQDEYADQEGFDEDSIGPVCTIVFDPMASGEGMVLKTWDVMQASRLLTFLRAEWQAEQETGE